MAVTLKEGDLAPLFSAKDQDGKKISLSDYAGRKLVLFFYPEAGSLTCTLESCNLRDHYSLLKRRGFDVLGVSPDTETRQKKFELRHKLPFRLIADEAHLVTGAYGVRDMKKLFGREYMGILRTTFVIDENGIILKIFYQTQEQEPCGGDPGGLEVTGAGAVPRMR